MGKERSDKKNQWVRRTKEKMRSKNDPYKGGSNHEISFRWKLGVTNVKKKLQRRNIDFFLMVCHILHLSKSLGLYEI